MAEDIIGVELRINHPACPVWDGNMWTLDAVASAMLALDAMDHSRA